MDEYMPPRGPEKELLGGLIRWNEPIAEVIAILREDDFYEDSSRKIFRAIVDTWGRGVPFDAAIIADVLHERGQIEDIGGYGYLGMLLEVAPTGANAVVVNTILVVFVSPAIWNVVPTGIDFVSAVTVSKFY